MFRRQTCGTCVWMLFLCIGLCTHDRKIIGKRIKRNPNLIFAFVIGRNYTMPSDIIQLIVHQWILQPSQMTMNELVERRDNGHCIWSDECNREINGALARCHASTNHSLLFVPSKNIYVFYADSDYAGFHVVVFARGSKSKMIYEYDTRGPRFTMMITQNQVLFGSSFSTITRFPRDDTDPMVAINWTVYGCNIVYLLKFKRANEEVDLRRCILLRQFMNAANLTNDDIAVDHRCKVRAHRNFTMIHSPEMTILAHKKMHCILL